MEEKNNSKASIGFVLGIVAIVVMFFYPDPKTLQTAYIIMAVLGLAATILGFMAKSDIKKQPQKGSGLATASVVIGIIMLVLSIFGFIGLKMLNDPEIVNQTICPLTTDCVELDEEHYTCDYFGTKVTCDKSVIDKEEIEQEETNTEE